MAIGAASASDGPGAGTPLQLAYPKADRLRLGMSTDQQRDVLGEPIRNKANQEFLIAAHKKTSGDFVLLVTDATNQRLVAMSATLLKPINDQEAERHVGPGATRLGASEVAALVQAGVPVPLLADRRTMAYCLPGATLMAFQQAVGAGHGAGPNVLVASMDLAWFRRQLDGAWGRGLEAVRGLCGPSTNATRSQK